MCSRSVSRVTAITSGQSRTCSTGTSLEQLMCLRETTVDEIHKAVKSASEGALKGVLAWTDEPLVSVDFNHNPASSIYDTSLTRILGGKQVKVCAWYDNEWGFSNRMLDTTVAFMAAR